ncbi:MAG TPA: hypothetical protein EYH45_02965 [Candidatus Caldiarchaeum subterraneum]|uniref:LUD domain-containing protein n=1 Tax=Caldiarchaeum subterraneum TaxID=311458 RepID=A0A833EA92_CALS0|nr:hypothetical protein [Candidatus Caldarchaeum subterraneum]
MFNIPALSSLAWGLVVLQDVEDPVEVFKFRFEQQAGKVYEVSDFDRASLVVSQVLIGQNVSKVVLADMPEEYRRRLEERMTNAGIQVIELEDNLGSEVSRVINLADAGVSVAEFAVADVGAVVEITQDDKDRLVSSLPKLHISLVRRDKIIGRFEDVADSIRETIMKRGNCVISFIGGPSRTGDIELKLVLGVHGPHQVHVIIFGES